MKSSQNKILDFVIVTLAGMMLSIAYGILHDMITAHICIEYFTIGHPKVIESESPVLLALTWGVIATWWVGLPMGILLASFNYIGRLPSLPAKEVVILMLKILRILFILAMFSGLTGYLLADYGVVYLPEHLADSIEPKKHTAFLSDGFAHTASYIGGVFGTIILCFLILKRRRKISRS